MRVDVIPTRREHVAPIAATMRADDRAEVWAWARHDPEAALLFSLDVSALSWTGLIDGIPAAMFGVGVGDGYEATPWFLGSDVLERMPPRLFARMSRDWLDRMMIFPVLANWSDARNVRSHAWLKWLGFTIGEARPAGVMGLPFVPFAMETAHV